MNKAFYKKAVNLIPSPDLKNYAALNRFQFDEKSLLKIILHYAPTFGKKLKLFEEAARIMDDENARKLAKERLEFEKKLYASFMRTSPDTVYAIEIKTAPYAADEEIYITKTFDEAVILIKDFLKYYEIKASERADARYTLKKKSTALPKKPYDFYNNNVGTLGECILDGKFRIIYLDMNNSDGNYAECKGGLVDCGECGRCVDEIPTRFPPFLKLYDLVAYFDNLKYDPTRLTYGIYACDMKEFDANPLIVTFEDNEYIKNRNADYTDEHGYFRVYDAHAHPEPFTIIKPDLKNVPETVLEDYAYAVRALKKIAAQN